MLYLVLNYKYRISFLLLESFNDSLPVTRSAPESFLVLSSSHSAASVLKVPCPISAKFYFITFGRIFMSY